MDDFAKILYEKFFMRDVLGKLGPGGITAISLIKVAGGTEVNVALFGSAMAYFILLPLFYLTGVALQICGEFIGVHSPSPKPRWILFRQTSGSRRQANTDFDERLALIRGAPTDKWPDGAKEQRERFVYLKEGSGNMAIALVIASVCLILSSKLALALLAFVTAVALYASHRLHAKRQARFEINILRKSEIISSERAEEMSQNL